MKLINALDKLKILLFWEIVEKQNPLLLDPEYSEDKVYTPDEKFAAKSIWLDIYDAYYLLEDDAMTKAVLMEQSKLLYSLEKINMLIENMNYIMYCCNLESALPGDDFDEMIQKIYSIVQKIEPGIAIQYFEPIEKNIALIDKWIRALTAKHEINHARGEKDVKRRIKNVYDVVVSVSISLGIQLNVEDMNCKAWIAYKKIAVQRNLPKPKKDTQDGQR